MTEKAIILHGYWRSGTSYRTRIALNAKGLRYHQVTYDLRLGEQRSDTYLAVNPQGLVPTIEVEGIRLIQSGAIIEWLEERFPTPPLLPSDPRARAIVRAMSMIVACDVHPLNNVRVLNFLREDMHADEEAISRWIRKWMTDAFASLEDLVSMHGGAFCFGDSLSAADCHIIPQLYSAERFGIDLTPFPKLTSIVEKAKHHPAVAMAIPERQPDAP